MRYRGPRAGLTDTRVNEHIARKRFGQNFLHDANTIARIIAAIAPQPGDHIVEIGPGQGALTRQLVNRCARLDVIEIDHDLAASLAQQEWAAGIGIHTADALDFDFSILADKAKSHNVRLRLVGNLPYNISTPLLFHILDQAALFTDMHVMLQKEVVQRMAAGPGSRTYGRLSVALAARCRVETLFTIKPGAFRPAPKVQSAFARLVPLDSPRVPAQDWPAFEQILRSAFGQRRKQLGNALQAVMNPDAIRQAGVQPTQRAEQLGIDDFARLARVATRLSG